MIIRQEELIVEVAPSVGWRVDQIVPVVPIYSSAEVTDSGDPMCKVEVEAGIGFGPVRKTYSA